MKKLLTILMVVGVSLSSAEDLQQSGITLQARIQDDSVSVGVRCAPNKGLMIAPQYRVKGAESIFVRFSNGGKTKGSGSKSFVKSLREEIRSFTDGLPDVSISWLGVFCYVRNPLRQLLAPGSTYAHEVGFGTGDWILSLDGIRANTLEDLHIALQCPVGKGICVFVRHSDMHYNVDVHVSGKLPWE